MSWYSPKLAGSVNSIPRSNTRTDSSAAVSSYWTIRRLPTITISRTLRGASQEICTFAVAPLSNVSVMNATSGTSSWKTLRPDAPTCDHRLVEQVEQDRQVVRREVADDAVGLVLAEVHARGRDEVDLAELVRCRISVRTLLTGGL